MTQHTLRTHVATWNTATATGSFEVDSYPGEDAYQAAQDYAREHVGTSAVIIDFRRKGA